MLAKLGTPSLTGRTGSGKSYLLKFLAANLQKYRTVHCDLRRGADLQILTAAFGGSYVELGQPDTARINPFSPAALSENFAFLYSFVRMLLESDGGARLNADEMRDVHAQIESVYVASGRNTKAWEPWAVASSQEQRLSRWIGSGQYGFLFDNAEDTLTFQPLPDLRVSQDAAEPRRSGGSLVLRSASLARGGMGHRTA